MGGQVVVGVLKVPQVVGDDVQHGHIRPEHILLFLGGVDAPPAGHAQDVDDTRNAVDPVPPAAVQPDVLTGQPPAGTDFGHSHSAADAGLKVTGNSDQNIDGHNGKGEGFEPMGLAHAPLVLEHHEADAADGGSIKLGIMEPAVHVQV